MKQLGYYHVKVMKLSFLFVVVKNEVVINAIELASSVLKLAQWELMISL